VAERELEVKRRFEAAAQFRKQTVDANFFASAIHKDHLIGYEPVYPWEKRPLIAMDRAILVQAGIDPATVTCQGHCAAIKREIYKRRSQRLAEIPRLAALARTDKIKPEHNIDLWQLSADDARAIFSPQWAGTVTTQRR